VSGRIFIPSLSAVVLLLISLLMLAASPGPAMSGSATSETVAYASLEPNRDAFRTTVRQRHDFSCGAAAVATLLIHHYGSDVTGQQVFAGMLREGDEEKIRSEGFSMLDMKRFLDGTGYDAVGYETSLERLGEMGLPGVVLITVRGLNHFVVVKGVSPTDVLLGDPVLGIRMVSRLAFDDIWNGMVLVIRSFPETGRRSFNRHDEWEAGLRAVASEELLLPASGKVVTEFPSEKGMMSRAGHRGISR
jgi:uncharacterized protein